MEMMYYRRNQSQLGSFIRCPAAINTKQKARNLDIDMEPPVNWRLKDKISWRNDVFAQELDCSKNDCLCLSCQPSVIKRKSKQNPEIDCHSPSPPVSCPPSCWEPSPRWTPRCRRRRRSCRWASRCPGRRCSWHGAHSGGPEHGPG